MGSGVRNVRKEAARQLSLDVKIPLLNITSPLEGVARRLHRDQLQGVSGYVRLRIPARRDNERGAERTRSGAAIICCAGRCQSTVALVQSARRGQPLIVAGEEG